MNRMFSVVAVIAGLLCSLTRPAAALCPLCSSAGIVPKNLNYYVASGVTCRNVYLNMAGLSPSSSQCTRQQNLYRYACCTQNLSPSVSSYVPPTRAPVYTGPVGSNPTCHICGTLEYPGIPSGFIVARYVGSYSCRELYDRGLHGLIPGFMCAPLQNYAEPVCGCGHYNPKCQANSAMCYRGP